MKELLSIKEASVWASEYLNKNVSSSNISYLIQYGRIKRIGQNGSTKISKKELKKYYKNFNGTKEKRWKDRLGNDLNWVLSFDNYKESETTKHVHRLHPYKGKFIPQLVEYFLDSKTDNFKKEMFFEKGNTVLDPFCGSGTTLVQANELGINAVGIDISEFNSFITNNKLAKFNTLEIDMEANQITEKLSSYISRKSNTKFEKHLLDELKIFNNKYFPSPDYRYKLAQKEIDEEVYGKTYEKKFLKIYQNLLKQYKIEVKQKSNKKFLNQWLNKIVKLEVDYVNREVKKIEDEQIRNILSLVLSRTIRSCRSTTHSDLATLLEPQVTTYYCHKHGKICKPIFSIIGWWKRYVKDTIRRLDEFNNLRTKTNQFCLTGDSRKINVFDELKLVLPQFGVNVEKKKIDGIFSSPPYVGMIDYHEQHAYSYDLLKFKRKDRSEIGPLYKGKGKAAQKSYAKGISKVLLNCKKFLKNDYDIFLVANDKHNLYPTIAKLAGMKIVNQYKRPVLNRTDKNRNAYSEIIFHLKRQ
jgi:DNA methylase